MRPLRVICAMILLAVGLCLPLKVDASDRTIIILARHGESEYNAARRFQGALDIPLSEKGLKQADMLAAGLKNVPIDVFISSPMQRAYVTTQKCADLHGKEIAYTDKRLSEASYGDWSGKSRDEIQSRFPREYKLLEEQRLKYTPPKGESLKTLQKRCRAALNDIVKKYPGQTIFVGAHSACNAVLICSVLDVGLNHSDQFRQDNTCVDVLEYKNGRWRLLLMNSVEHLGYLYKNMGK